MSSDGLNWKPTATARKSFGDDPFETAVSGLSGVARNYVHNIKGGGARFELMFHILDTACQLLGRVPSFALHSSCLPIDNVVMPHY